jgi:hypothetical protein
MIHPLVKIITVDGFLTEEDGTRLGNVIRNLQYVQKEFGKEIENFNLVQPDANKLFSDILNTNIEVDEDRSGIFRKPELFIHFEGFDALNEWIFVVALEPTFFNIYEHESGAKCALEGVNFNYRNLFEWGSNTKAHYDLKPGEGVLFRPWLFHSFDGGLIQIFRLREIE